MNNIEPNTIASDCQGENVYSDKIDENEVKTRQSCQNVKCPHNMFYEKIFDSNGTDLHGQKNHLIPHETDVSRSFFNCTNEVDRPFTLEEIGEMYLVSGRMTIWRIINQGIKNLKKQKKQLAALREYHKDN